MPGTWIGRPVAAFLAVLISGASVRADPFQQGAAMSAETVFARCPETGGVATSLCLGKEVDKLRATLKIRIARQLRSIAGVAARPSGVGMLGGAAAAAAWKRDFLAAQADWQVYDSRECRNVADYEWYGGSGAGSAELACEIRHLVIRINELATP